MRAQHEASIQNLKESFEARFTTKLAQVYEKREEEMKETKEAQDEDMRRMMVKYEEAIQKFRKKYNQELEGIQSQLNIKSSDHTEVEDRMVHLKCFVQDLITRLKQREVRCFEMESEVLKLKENLNYLTGERASLVRTVSSLKGNYKEGLLKLKKEYKRQFYKGLDTLMQGGLLTGRAAKEGASEE